MTVKSFIEYKGLHPGIIERELKRAIKKANFEVVNAWHKTFLPEHFTSGAVRKYGYMPRNIKYNRAKKKKLGHQRPLEFSGHGKSQALKNIKISGTSKGARGRMPGTQVFNFQRHSWSPDMREELLATTKLEDSVLAEIHRLAVVKHLNGVKSNKKVRA